MKYSVKELADLAGVSVRTLHHYDQIDLLKPSSRNEHGYRLYERRELLLLQQILLYRELGFTLKEINSIVNDASFNLLDALEEHKEKLKRQKTKLDQLISTIDKTIDELKNHNMMKVDEIYAGFPTTEVPKMRQEVIDRWGAEELETVEKRICEMGRDGWEETQKKGEEINQLLADIIHLPTDHITVQKAIELHFRHLNLFYKVSEERYRALGKMYTEDERFRQNYDRYAQGLSDFIYSGILIFCDNGLTVNKS